MPTGGFRLEIDKFKIRPQDEDMWCWAAVAVSIDDFFSGGAMDQCALADPVLHLPFPTLPSCCVDEFGCDEPWYADDALDQLHRLATGPGTPTGTGMLTFDQVFDQIKAGLPICVEIEWAPAASPVSDPSPIGHYVVIAGCRQSGAGVNQQVRVDDPNGLHPTTTWVSYAAFTTTYSYRSTPGVTPNGGKWVDSYLVKK